MSDPRRRLPSLFFYQAYEPAFAAELFAVGVRVSQPLVLLLVAAPLVAGLWGRVPHTTALQWLGLVAVSALTGHLFRRHYLSVPPAAMQEADVRRGERLSVAYTATVGIAWGCLSQLMVPGDWALNLAIMVVYFGAVAGAGAATVFAPARLITPTICNLPLFLLPFGELFGSDAYWLGALVVLYNLAIVATTWSRTRAVIDNMRLRRENEMLLQGQREEALRAHRANQEKSAFLAAASHDLRQPLHALMLTTHALVLRTTDAESLQMIERIIAAGRALAQQFDQLMDLSRLEGGSYRVQPAELALAPVLQQVVHARRQVAEDKGLRLRLRVARPLEGLVVQADAALLTRIVDNLLDNAIKYTGAGRGVLLTLRLRAGRPELAVRDQGIGIAADQIDQVFKPYVQLDNPTRDLGRGVGLGLSIVQSAARLLDGTLDVRSEPGRGSAFALRLPLQAVRGVRRRAVEPAPVSASALRGKRLLLVEDDPMVAAALAPWFEAWGVQAIHHDDPSRVPADLAPDLIICDIRLPGARDGIAWLTEWLAQWPDSRGLLMSGELTAAQRAEQEGLMMLAKPAEPETLLRTLTGMADD